MGSKARGPAIDAYQALLGVFLRAGYEAVMIGRRPLIKAHNQFHDEPALATIAGGEVITNADADWITRTFSTTTTSTDGVVTELKFGNEPFLIYHYHVIVDGKRRLVESMDEHRLGMMFTYQTLTENADGELGDLVVNGSSAMSDVKHGVIRFVGDPDELCEQRPWLILEVAAAMAELGYELEQTTEEAMKQHVEAMEQTTSARAGQTVRRLMRGRYAARALMLLGKLKVFRHSVVGLDDQPRFFLRSLRRSLPERLVNLERVASAGVEDELSRWSVLYLGHDDKLVDDLIALEVFTEAEVHEISWLIHHRELPLESNLMRARWALYQSIDEYMLDWSVHDLKKLVLKLGRLHKALTDDGQAEVQRLFFNMCSRPYLVNQLTVTGHDMLVHTDRPRGPWIEIVKRRLLEDLILAENYPTIDEILDTWVPRAMRECAVSTRRTPREIDLGANVDLEIEA